MAKSCFVQFFLCASRVLCTEKYILPHATHRAVGLSSFWRGIENAVTVGSGDGRGDGVGDTGGGDSGGDDGGDDGDLLSRTRMQYTELGRKDKEVGRTAEGEARLEAWTRQGGVPI